MALPAGWRLFFYTDGLIEGRAAPGSQERFGEAGLIEAMSTLCGADDRRRRPGAAARRRRGDGRRALRRRRGRHPDLEGEGAGRQREALASIAVRGARRRVPFAVVALLANDHDPRKARRSG